MLRIQLCPAGELENKQWWLPDVVALVVSATVCWLLVAGFLASLNADIEQLKATSIRWSTQTAELAPIIEKYKSLDQEITLLNRKIDVLAKITVSKTDKIMPIVVMEQLQTLRPLGVWYQAVELKQDRSLTIEGASKDSLLVSEFLLGLRETMNPATWTSDVRTQIGYEAVSISRLVRVAVDKNFDDQKDVLAFDISAKVKEKEFKQVNVVAIIPNARSRLGSHF